MADAETPILWKMTKSSALLMQSADSFEKTLMMGKIEGGKRRGYCGSWGHKESNTTEQLK